MSFKSIVRASGPIIFMLLSTSAMGQQVPPDFSAHMPSKAEMRQSLVDSGMTPDQIETILNKMDFPSMPSLGETEARDENKPCVDDDKNEICDTDEATPEIIHCRKIYQSEIHATSSELYGSDLGKNSVEVAQTCSMAAAGGGAGEKSWAYDLDRLLELSSYWNAVLSHGRNFNDNHIPEMDDLSDAQIEALVSKFPPDLKAMMSIAGHQEFNDIARPIHDKCEKVRLRVRDNYFNNRLVEKVCVRYVPNADLESE